MVARSELEFEIFQKMDIERKEEAKLAPVRKARLIEESELPDWLVKEDDEVDTWNYAEEESLLGRGTRQRKEVDYTDSLTEKEWLKVIFFFKISYLKMKLNNAFFLRLSTTEVIMKMKRRRKKKLRNDADVNVVENEAMILIRK